MFNRNRTKPFLGRAAVIAILAAGSALPGPSFGQTSEVPLAKQRIITGADGKTYMLKSRLKSVLVTSFFYNYNHGTSIKNMIETIQRIGGPEGWTVDVAASGTDITTAKLRGYQVLFGNSVSSWASKPDFGEVGRQAVQDFVEKQGGGMIIMHGSGDSRISTNWDWFYNVAHPVIYTGENTHVDAPVFVPKETKTHPVMQGVGIDTIIFKLGEWHRFAKRINVLHPEASIYFKMDPTGCPGCAVGVGYDNPPGGYPASWSFPAGKGTIGYFMEGHDLNTMNSMTTPVWDRFFKQFLYYVAGYDTTLVTSAVKSDLGFPLESSGVTFHPSDAPGVLITKPGMHTVSLFAMTGQKIKEVRSGVSPIDYDFGPDLRGAKSGVYVMRVSLPGLVKSKRILVK